MNGPELVTRIGELEHIQNMAIVVVSSDQAGIKEARSAGANAWLLKPVNPKTFETAIHTIIERTVDDSGEQPLS